MAYLQARSNIMRAGVTHTGWAPSDFTFKVDGVERAVQHNSRAQFSIQEQLGQPGKILFEAHGYMPEEGDAVQFVWTTPAAYLFAGTVTRRARRLDRSAVPPVWQCEALDNTWLLNRYSKVTAQYRGLGVNAIVARILANFTNGGFKIGYCPSTLGDISAIDFEYVDVSDAIDQVMAACGGFWLVDPERCIYCFDTLPDGNALTVGNSTAIQNVDYDDDLTQQRNRTIVLGNGSTATALTYAGATTLAVENTEPFTSSGGRVTAERNLITYTGYTTASGPGTLTGCSGIDNAIPPGARVRVYAQADDTAAQTLMATTLGLSGIIAHVIDDDALTDAEAGLLAAEDVAAFSTSPSGLEYDVTDKVSSIGKLVTVNITDPISVVGSYRIQSVTLTPRTLTGADMSFSRRVNARVLVQTMAALLRKVA